MKSARTFARHFRPSLGHDECVAYDKFLGRVSHDGATLAPMQADRNDSRSSALEGITLRLTTKVLRAIDGECARRVGSVSRNTWITAAVTERLGRLASSSHPQGGGGANG